MLRIALYVVGAIIALKVLGEIVGFIMSSWMIIAIAAAIWYFGFKKGKG